MFARRRFDSFQAWLGPACLALALGFGAGTPPAWAQAFQRYGIEAGLPSVAVTDVVEDAHGFLWVSTLNGLCRFDGVAFDCRLHDPDDPTSPATDYLWGTPHLVDATGTLWAGTPYGVQRYEPATGAFVHDAYRAEASEAALLEAAPDGMLWIGHEHGLDLYDPRRGVVRTYTQEDGLLETSPASLALDPATQALWVGMETGFQRLEDGEVVQTVATQAMAFAFHVRRDGSLLVGTFGDGLHRLRPDGTLEQVLLPREALQVTSLTETPDGALWVGTWEGGLLHLDGGTLALLDHIQAAPTDPYGLPSGKVATVAVDAGGVLWVATWNGLVRMLDPSPFVTVPAPAEIAPMVTALEGSADGSLWIGTAEGFYSLDQAGSTEGAYPSEGPWKASGVDVPGTVRAFAPDSEGGVWVGFETGDLGYFSPDRTWTPLDSTLLPPSSYVFGLHLDRRDRLWAAAGARGLCVIDVDQGTSQCLSTRSPAPQALPTNQTYALDEGPDGSVLVGTLGAGVVRVAPDLTRVEPYGRSDTEAGRALARARVATLEATPDGTLWVGALDGLYRVGPEGDVQRFSETDGLPHRMVHCIQQDAQGLLWMSTGAGLAMLDPSENRFARFSAADMIPSLSHYFETCSPYADALWVGGHAGLVGFVPERVRTSEAPPPVLITAVEVDGEVVARTAVETPLIRVPASTQQITVAFSGIDHRRPEDLRYAYRLDGGVDAWTEIGNDRAVTFSQLRPGRYTFRVRATSSLGVVGVQEASVPLTVLTPLWLRPWFLGLLLALAVTVAWAMHRYHLNRTLEIERTRLRIAQDLHDDINSQVAALGIQVHAIEGLVETRPPDAVQALLARCQEHIQALSTAVRDLVWVIGTERDQLADLMRRVEEVAYALLPGVRVTVTVEGDQTVALGMQARKHLLFFCKEVLHNAAKHAEASGVRVHAALDADALVLTLADDGRGFPDGLMHGSSTTVNPLLAQGDGAPNPTGYGLRSLQNRAATLGGRLQTHSAPGAGVEYVLTVPRHQLAERDAALT